jgi:hypothetical protein
MSRTFTITCPYCAADVEARPRDMRVRVELHGEITADVEFIAPHRCAPVSGASE